MHKEYIISLIILLLSGAFLTGYLWYKRPKVSVVMLTYKRPHLVSRAIDSILAQTYQDFEFIIVNDGSNDNTGDVVKSYKDKRIRYYENDKNMGISWSRNRAKSYVRGKYVMIMDDDDVSLPERMQKQVEFLEKNPDIDVVSGTIIGFKTYLNHNDIATGLIQYNNVGNANVMYRQSFAKKNNINYANVSYAEDWYFWLQMLFNGANFAGINDVVLERNYVSERHYENIDESKATVTNYIDSFFNVKSPTHFYELSACDKLNHISKAPTLIFSQSYFYQLKNANGCHFD